MSPLIDLSTPYMVIWSESKKLHFSFETKISIFNNISVISMWLVQLFQCDSITQNLACCWYSSILKIQLEDVKVSQKCVQICRVHRSSPHPNGNNCLNPNSLSIPAWPTNLMTIKMTYLGNDISDNVIFLLLYSLGFVQGFLCLTWVMIQDHLSF